LGMMMPGMDNNGMGDMLQNLMPKKKHKRTMTVKKARQYLKDEEAEKLIDLDNVNDEAIELAETTGIIFIDEIDKIAKSSQHSGDVSREGVQRDIDRKSTRLNSSHVSISYAVFCLKKKIQNIRCVVSISK